MVDELAYFVADDAAHGHQVWVSDGTPAGTVLVSDIKPSGFRPYSATYLGTLGDIVFFFADDRAHGRELWRTDGTPAGTWLVKDIMRRRSHPAQGIVDRPAWR